VRVEVCIDCADPQRLASWWAAVLGEGEVQGSGEPYCTIAGVPAGLPELVFQRVPEAKAGKNRLHLDLYVDDPAAEVARVEALGATRIDEPVQGGDACAWWQVMADPEGNEFCICAGPANFVLK
jgi:predicted enzyme related to lactoylglutathione lyase